MAKSKNHTSHTAAIKNHKNGIKPAKRERYTSTKGMHPTYLRNLRRARAGLYKKEETTEAPKAESKKVEAPKAKVETKKVETKKVVSK